MIKTLLKPFAWCAAWSFYWIGDVCCKLMEMKAEDENLWLSFWFRAYQLTMRWSGDAQDFVGGTGDRWPWQPVDMDKFIAELEAEEA